MMGYLRLEANCEWYYTPVGVSADHYHEHR